MNRELRSFDRFKKGMLILFVAVVVYPIGIASQEPTNPDHTVSLTLTITDKSGRYVSGLRKDQITVLDEDAPQEISYFGQSNAPVSVVFLLDMSALKRTEIAKAARSGLLRFVAASDSVNDYFIAGIDVDSYADKPFIRDANSMGSEFDRLAKAGLTSKSTLFDAFKFGFDKVKSGANRKHVIVLVGNDDGDALKRRMPELLESIKQSDVIFYAVKLKNVIGSNLRSTAFDELSSISGGKSFYPTSDYELHDTFEIVALELVHQYALVFRPANPTKVSAKWHRLQVRVKPLQIKESPSATKTVPVPLFARTRNGYYQHHD